VDELEEVLEAHLPSYSRHSDQHSPAVWAPMLRQDGLFTLLEYRCTANLVTLRGPAELRDALLDGKGSVQGAALSGEARPAFSLPPQLDGSCFLNTGGLPAGGVFMVACL
jgi:hypothetical protein